LLLSPEFVKGFRRYNGQNLMLAPVRGPFRPGLMYSQAAMFQALQWTIQGASCGLAAGLVLLLGSQLFDTRTVAAQPQVADVVRARRFDLVDATGATTSQWLTVDGQPGLVLGRTAKQRSSLRPRGLRVTGAFGYTVVSGQSLGAYADESNAVLIASPVITMKRAGKPRISLSVVGGASVTVNDAAGRPRAVVGSHSWHDTKTGAQSNAPESSIALWDENGMALLKAP
jgi:hypothetical protein